MSVESLKLSRLRGLANRILGNSEAPHPLDSNSRLPLILLDLNGQAKEYLRQAILEQNGTVDILVHPFYYEEEAEDWYKSRLKSYLRNATSNRTPVIVFEEHSTTKKNLGRKLGPGNFYVVPTRRGDPEPYPILGNYDDPWEHAAKILRELGVVNIRIGGRYMYLRKDNNVNDKWKDRVVLHAGCVGRTIKELSDRGFNISELTVTSPATLDS